TSGGWADAVIIMGYPLRAIDANYAGGLAPMFSNTSYDLLQIVRAYLRNTSPGDVVLALPWYGRQWPTQTSDLNSAVQTNRLLFDRAHNINYDNALALAAANGRQYDPVEQSAWSAFRWQYCQTAPE